MILALALATVVALTNGRHLVIVPPDTSPIKGAVLLVPGGSTLLKLGPNGETNSSNFVIRTRRMLLDAGYAIAYMDNPADLREAIARLRSVARPVVILSTSRGTVVAARNALTLGKDGPDLMVLTSPVTSGASSLAQVDVKSIATPTLIVANNNDSCRVSSPGNAATMSLEMGNRASSAYFSSTAQHGDPCEPMSPHGYLGIESDVIGKIVDWIAAHATS